MVETHKRTIMKTLSWRLVATIITGTVSGLITESWTVGLTIGAADTVLKLGAYYLHERAWMRVRHGYIQGTPGLHPASEQ
mgnify:FL=1